MTPIKLIVTGHMRSGTTFIANFLNSQNNVYVYRDFNNSILDNAEILKIDSIDSPLTDTQKNILISSLNAEYSAINYKKIAITSSEFNTINELFDFALMNIPSISNFENGEPKVVGLKTTNELLYLEELLDKDYKILVMIRDPRDIVISAKNRFAWYDLNSTIKKIDDLLSVYRSNANRQNLMILKYEDLMRQPQKSIDKILDFLQVKIDINYNIDILKDRDKLTYQENSSFGDISTLFDTKGIGRWQNYKETEEVKFVNTVLKEHLKYFDYELESAGSSKFQILFKYGLFNFKNGVKDFAKKLLK